MGASANQIQAVLRQQPGLLVELKRWVAQEAASNGQIVKDSDLTDQKIFARLVSDTQFRSVATRLLERYGYLVPKTQPGVRCRTGAKTRPASPRKPTWLKNRISGLKRSCRRRTACPSQPYQQTRDCQESDSQGTQTEQNYDQNRGDRSRDAQGQNQTTMQVCPPSGRSSPQEIRTAAFSPQSKLRLDRIRRAVRTLPITMKTTDLFPLEFLPSAERLKF